MFKFRSLERDIKIIATPGSSFTPTPLGHEENVGVGKPSRANALHNKAFPPKSPDLNLCDFRLRGYLKDAVFSVPTAHSAELRSLIAQHSERDPRDTSIVGGTCSVSGFKLVAEIGEQHNEHVLRKSHEI
ncbi:hypothetical protein TNCV_1203181 [Trichonephila clavipes]|nr:hypothetical protein TNCV_1203181 [Trichonephila clavipes]